MNNMKPQFLTSYSPKMRGVKSCPLPARDWENALAASLSRKLIMSPAKSQVRCELIDRVYLITCNKCEKYYVGETGRPFRSRIHEHKLSGRKPKDSRIPLVSKHFTGSGHSIKDMQFSILELTNLSYCVCILAS